MHALKNPHPKRKSNQIKSPAVEQCSSIQKKQNKKTTHRSSWRPFGDCLQPENATRLSFISYTDGLKDWKQSNYFDTVAVPRYCLTTRRQSVMFSRLRRSPMMLAWELRGWRLTPAGFDSAFPFRKRRKWDGLLGHIKSHRATTEVTYRQGRLWPGAGTVSTILFCGASWSRSPGGRDHRSHASLEKGNSIISNWHRFEAFWGPTRFASTFLNVKRMAKAIHSDDESSRNRIEWATWAKLTAFPRKLYEIDKPGSEQVQRWRSGFGAVHLADQFRPPKFPFNVRLSLK